MFKIIETEAKYPDVLLQRDVSERGSDIVIIKAIGTIDNKENMFASEEITFENYKSANRFITDFSYKSAEEWCIKEGITY